MRNHHDPNQLHERRGGLGEAIFGSGGLDTDIPRSPFAPSIGAMADLDRRIAHALGNGWRAHLSKTIDLAVRIMLASPEPASSPYGAATPAELLAELRTLRPELMRAPAFVRLVQSDPVLLRNVVDAYAVIEAYRARATRAQQ